MTAKNEEGFSEGSNNSRVCLFVVFKNKTPTISFGFVFTLWYLSKWTNVNYVMK